MAKEDFREEEHPRDKLGQFTKLSTKELKEKLKIDYGKFVKTGETTVITPEIKEGDYRGSDKYPRTTSYYELAKTPKEEYQRMIELEELYGKEFNGYKGQEAVDKLYKEKCGHVKNAFFREDIGMIDLVWGNKDFGLCHIITRREEQGININDFLSNLSNCVEKGKFRKENKRGNYEVMYGNKIAVISPRLCGNKVLYLLSAFKTHSKK